MEPNPPVSEAEQLALLRQLLLREERILIEKHDAIFEQDSELDAKIGPVIEAHLERLKSKFPEHYNKHVDQMIMHRISTSKDEIVGAIYPELGNMIKKYVQFQIEQLRESIALQLEQQKQSLFFWRRKQSATLKADALLANSIPVRVEQVFLIKQPEGTIIAHAAHGPKLSPDAVAGMLTALKAFMSDAFDKNAQQVEKIQYETHLLLLQSYHSYYFAALLSGPVTSSEQDDFSNTMFAFLQAELYTLQQSSTQDLRGAMEQRLADLFQLDNIATY